MLVIPVKDGGVIVDKTDPIDILATVFSKVDTARNGSVEVVVRDIVARLHQMLTTTYAYPNPTFPYFPLLFVSLVLTATISSSPPTPCLCCTHHSPNHTPQHYINALSSRARRVTALTCVHSTERVVGLMGGRERLVMMMAWCQ